MNEDLKKSLFLTMPTVILSMGIIAPLYAVGTLRTNLMLGILAVILLMLLNVTIALLRLGTQKNGRIGTAILITGGLLTIVKVALSAVPLSTSLPVETLAPLMLIVAVLAVATDAYDIKKKLSPALFDGVAIGLSFLLILCLSGVIRDLIGSSTFNGLPVIKRSQPLHMFVLVPGVFLIAALIASLLLKKKRGAP